MSEDPDNPHLTVEDIKEIMSYDPEAEVARLEEKLDAVERDLDTLKAKLAEVATVLSWATVNIRDLSNFRWIVSDDLNWSVTTKDYQSFTEPTIYEALHKSWQQREGN